MIENSKEIQERELEESNDRLAEPVPPVDIVAFTEARSCADLFRLFQKQQLEIQPNFQRKVVWSDRDQTLFVDSLMKQMPIPSLCISLDAKTQQRVVIDGLQRMYTIIRFLDFAQKDWRLSCSEDVDERISGKLVSEIHDNESALFSTLENLTIPVTVLRCDYSKSTHMDYLFQIFRRLNSGGRHLLNQEIRNCIYQGSFNTMIKRLSRSEKWCRFAGVTPKKVMQARFAHEERILRFFAFNELWSVYAGHFAAFLNDYMEAYKDSNARQLENFEAVFNDTMDIACKIGVNNMTKNVADAVLVGIAHNLGKLKDMGNAEIQSRYQALMAEAEYSAAALGQGLSQKEKVSQRIKKSIEVFGRD